jgi:alpha-amylase/alpha-mannosidase (GH57 family)
VKLTDIRIQSLIKKASGFTLEDRLELIAVISELLDSVLDRYKTLAESGQIELSMTPYAHPIIPLLLDIKSAHEAMPHAPLPALAVYPGGEQRVAWHIDKGLDTFQRFFGYQPKGCWPSEGAVSEATLQLLATAGFTWAASGGSVLRNSLTALEDHKQQDIHHPYRLKNADIACFFRDDGLSDLIGFEYSKWHGDDAVDDLIQHLENIAAHESPESVVSIIMDGENAWEYFPDNGYHFLSALYQRLANHPAIELTTFSECLYSNCRVKLLPKMTAGSWVYGTFSTWIGDADKNRGWDMLGDAKQAFDKTLARNQLSPLQIEQAELQLAICEGSDWFWWFGDYNPGEAVSNFEKQFRLNLANLYDLLGQKAPAYLAISFTQGSDGSVMGGTMRPGTEN